MLIWEDKKTLGIISAFFLDKFRVSGQMKFWFIHRLLKPKGYDIYEGVNLAGEAGICLTPLWVPFPSMHCHAAKGCQIEDLTTVLSKQTTIMTTNGDTALGSIFFLTLDRSSYNSQRLLSR